MNWVLAGSMRAPGEAVGLIALEGAMDELAEKLSIDPIELQAAQRARAGSRKGRSLLLPLARPRIDEGAERFGWDQRQAPGDAARGRLADRHGRRLALRGRTCCMKSLGQGRAPPRRHRHRVSSAMTDIGTGSYTILSQIAAELLGLPMERITMRAGRHQPCARRRLGRLVGRGLGGVGGLSGVRDTAREAGEGDERRRPTN